MDLGIKGKWALVGGASKGLGWGCARALALEGVNVVMVARGAEVLNQSVTDLKKEAPGVTLIGVAVDDPSPNAVQVESFRKKYFADFRTYARQGYEIDELASVIDPAWNEVVPTTYVIDRRGKIAVRIQGKKSIEELRAVIKKSL